MRERLVRVDDDDVNEDGFVSMDKMYTTGSRWAIEDRRADDGGSI